MFLEGFPLCHDGLRLDPCGFPILFCKGYHCFYLCFAALTGNCLPLSHQNSVEEFAPMIVRAHLVKNEENNQRTNDRQDQPGRMKEGTVTGS